MALPRKQRLFGSGIKEVLKKGNSISSELFNIKFVPIGAAPSKFSVITSLRVSKKAATRNKIRRRIGEIIRFDTPKTRRGYFIVITVKPTAVDKEFKDLKENLTNILNRINQ